MKKLLALLSAAAMLTLSGCNSQRENTPVDTPSTEPTTAVTTTAATTTATTITEASTTAATTAETTTAKTTTAETTTAATTPATTTAATTTATTTPVTTTIAAATTTVTTTAATTTTVTTTAVTTATTPAATATTPEELPPEPEETDPYKAAAEKRRELLPEIDVPVYSDDFAGDYVLLTVKAEKIYWNYLENFQPAEGEPFTLLFPAVFYDVFKESDSVVLNFPDYNCPDYFKSLTADFKYLHFIPGWSWNAGLLYSIKDGILFEPDFIDRVDKYFTDGTYSGYYDFDLLMDYEGFPDEFYYGLTVDEVDLFMTEKHKQCAESQQRADEEREAGLVDCVYFSLGHEFMISGAEMRLSLVE